MARFVQDSLHGDKRSSWSWSELESHSQNRIRHDDSRFQAISTARSLSCRHRQPKFLESPPHTSLFYFCHLTDMWVQGMNSQNQSQEHTFCDTQGARDGMNNPLNGWGPRARCEEWPARGIVSAPSLIFTSILVKYPWPRS